MPGHLKATVLLVCLMSMTSAISAQQTGRLEGTVRDEVGAIFSGAGVHLMEWKTDSVRHTSMGMERTVICDAAGHYAFDLETGTYDLIVSAPAHLPVAKRVLLKPSSTYRFNPVLKPDPESQIIE